MSELNTVEPLEIVCTGWDTEVDPKTSEKYTTYQFELTLRDVQWTISKRFSQFDALNDLLALAFPHVTLPPLPEKRWFGNFSPDVLRERSAVLQDYLTKIIRHPELSNTMAINIFLELKKHRHHDIIPKVLIPLPDNDFDTTEVAVPWKLMDCSAFQIVFATETGKEPATDPLLIREEGVLFGQLGAELDARKFYNEMQQYESFKNPIRWDSINPSEYDGLLLPGGHAQGMRQYLESEVLREKVVEFWKLERPVAAICHGVLLLARCKDPNDPEHSVLYTRQTTSLPKYLENLGYYLTSWKLGTYYRTYDLHCEEEIKTFLQNPDSQFIEGPITLGDKGTLYDDSAAFVVQDKNYLSARWPGDAYLFGRTFIKMVEESIAKRRHDHHHYVDERADLQASEQKRDLAIPSFAEEPKEPHQDQPAVAPTETTPLQSNSVELNDADEEIY